MVSVGLIGCGEVGPILAEDRRAQGRDASLVPWSAAGTANRRARVADLADPADLGSTGLFGARVSSGFARSRDWRVEADRVLAKD